MKCLVIACEYPPVMGGVGNAAAMFAKQMVSRGWKVEVCTAADSALAAEENAEGVVIHRLALEGSASIWASLAGELNRFENILNEFSPDVAVLHGWQGWGVRLIPYIRAKDVPVILQSHGFGMHRIPWNRRPPFGLKVWAGYQPFIWRLPRLIRDMHALVVLSKHPDFVLSFDHWLGEKTGCSNVVTIPNGVEQVTATPEPFLGICPIAAGRRVVLSVANYCDRKNQLEVLDVAARIPDEDVMFVFIGGAENEYARALRSGIEARGLGERAVVLSGVSRAITESAIACCEIALMTSKWEMQPLFLIEAMSAAKPWVSTDVGSVKEMKGGIVTSLDTAELADGVRTLLQDASMSQSFGHEGLRQWREEFAPAVVYAKWERLLGKALHPTSFSKA